ncbi:GNAT family N-acetyltransferase [Hymenobacter cavernae]|uniref:BioF2-like acetyltransferase domain-containing protein n=1 Tax=Hymenobacter cavernae TaxID=2044852 RepID=A0ABQ1TYX5_9BACT|nr:GNAT family N-acetyltransferase [Hymenobacter cavernae]GGF05891.1 hypothetical protein GCM10011383_16280 [Hymenobacter cavernae]
MPLRYLRHSEINLAAWDACVAAAQQAVPYAYSWWLAATAGYWDAVVELSTVDNSYRSVLPLPVKWRPWGRQVYQPAFTQQLGLLTTAASQHRELADYLGLTAKRFAKFYIQSNVSNALFEPPPGFSSAERRTYLLDLSADYTTLLAGYASDYRRRLRRNQQQPAPLMAMTTDDGTALIQLFRLHKGGEVASLKGRHYQQLASLVTALQARNLALLLEVREPAANNLLAAALFVKHPRGLIYLFAAASPEGKQAGAPLVLLDEVIRRHAGTPRFILDFEGGMIPSIARFFANFGAKPASYAALAKNTRQPWYLLWKP